MKKTVLIISIMCICFFSFGQIITPSNWQSYKRISLNFEHFDIGTNANEDVFVAGGGAASGFNFSLVKYDSSGTTLFNKSYVSRNQGKGKLDVDANGDVFVITTFNDRFELGNDTFQTSSINNRDLFIGKFSGQNGDDIWSVNYSREDFMYAQLLPNNNYLVKLEAYPGPFILGGDTVLTITTRSEVFVVLDGNTGAVINHFSFPFLGTDGRKQNYVEGSRLTYYDVTGTFFSQDKYLRRNVMDLNTGSIVSQDTFIYRSQYVRPERSLTENGQDGSAYNPKTKELYIAIETGSSSITFGTDTLNAGEHAILKLDSQMNVLQVLRTEIGFTKMLLEDNRLVLGGLHTPNNTSNVVWFDSDSVTYPNSQKSYLVVSSDLSLNDRKYAFVATNQWQTGLELLNFDLDASQNVYALAWHEEDILFPPFAAASLNRSWKHNSAFGKLRGTTATGIADNRPENELDFKVYPNPVLSQVTLEVEGEFNFQIFDAQGRIVQQGAGNQVIGIDISRLVKGMYFVRIESSGQVAAKRIMKL